MLRRYNIALCPIEERVCDLLFRHAARFKASADGYCLGKERALPHLTLCHFSAENDEAASCLAGAFLSAEVDVVPSGFYVSPDVGEHEGMLWIGYAVERDSALVAVQAGIAEELGGKGIETYTQAGNAYFPHFTLAKVRRGAVEFPSAFFEEDFIGFPVRCRACLGASDLNGQFLRYVSDARKTG